MHSKSSCRTCDGWSVRVQVEEVDEALTWVTDHAELLGGDPHRVHLLGHSAGAHLCMLALLQRARSLRPLAEPSSRTQLHALPRYPPVDASCSSAGSISLPPPPPPMRKLRSTPSGAASLQSSAGSSLRNTLPSTPEDKMATLLHTCTAGSMPRGTGLMRVAGVCHSPANY
jgi:alpha-beta hydrolase superfamily lysophospholipase